MITTQDYLAGVGLNYDPVSHVTIQGCPLRSRHAHVQCAYCRERYALDLEKLDEVIRQQLQQHAARHRGT